MDNSNAIIPRQTMSQMADTWELATQEITQAMALLDAARERLRSVFQPDGYRFRFELGMNSHTYDAPDKLLREVQKDVWATLLDRMEIRKLMSLKEQEQLDKQLKTGEGMPEITLPNLLAMLEGTMARVPQMIEELIREVYDWLRPWRQSPHDYVTNQKNLWVLGRKVIKGYCVRPGYGRHWDIQYSRQPNLTALDNVFHALDGKGLTKTHRGALCDAICATEHGKDRGETDYFKFRLFKNGNLHLEIKRLDLLERFNAVAGGMRLGNNRDDAQQAA